MTAGPKSQLLAGIVVDTIPGPVSILTMCEVTAAATLHDTESVAVLFFFQLLKHIFFNTSVNQKQNYTSIHKTISRFYKQTDINILI